MDIDEHQPAEEQVTVAPQEPENDVYASVAAAVEEVEKSQPAEAETTTEPDNTKAHDETGKFTKKQEADKEVATTKDVATTAPVEGEQKFALPPNINKAWTPQEKAVFDKLPADVKATITAAIDRREADVHKEFTRRDEEREYGRHVKEAVTPYMPMLEAEGATPSVAIKTLLSHAHLLRHGTPQDKFNLWINTAKTYGIPLPKEFGIDTTKSSTASNFDPNAIVAQVPGLVQKELQNYTQKQEQAQIQSVIDTFASDPQNAHYEKVKPVMAALLQTGAAADMKDAYEQACYANPEIRSLLVQAQSADTEAKRVADIKAKSAAAKKAASSIAGAPGKTNGAARPANSNLDPYDSVGAAFDEVHAR